MSVRIVQELKVRFQGKTGALLSRLVFITLLKYLEYRL